MDKFKKYCWIRNLTLVSICGFLCYSLFPFSPFFWRVLLLVLAIITIWLNRNQIIGIEKRVIYFFLLNLIYFFVYFIWSNKVSTTQIGNISVSLLSMSLLINLGRKGVLDDKFYIIALVPLLLSCWYYYENLKILRLDLILSGREHITNNASTVFLYLLPYSLILKKRYLSYALILICTYFILDSAKRGNIVCAVPVLICYMIQTFKNDKVKKFEKIMFIVFILIAIFWGTKQIEQNEYLLYRLEKTLDGDSSGRDVIYSNAWDIFAGSDNIINIIFGYGFDATKHHPSMGIHAHNDWLEILVDYGIIGVLFYISIFSSLFVLIRREIDIQKRYLLISVVSIWFLKSLFSMGFTDSTMYILFLAFASAFRTDDLNKDSG